MRYYKIMFDGENANDEDMVCYTEEGFEDKYGIKQYDLYKGEYFESWNPDITFFYDSLKGDIPIDYMASDIGWALISPKFREVLKIVDITGIQVCPVKIKEKDSGKEIIGYSVINIISYTDALDLDNSVYDYFTVKKTEQQVLSVIKYALKSTALEGKHIVRLKDGKFATFVSERLKDEICRQKLRGCDFLEVKVV
jgi:hypothetical protein